MPDIMPELPSSDPGQLNDTPTPDALERRKPSRLRRAAGPLMCAVGLGLTVGAAVPIAEAYSKGNEPVETVKGDMPGWDALDWYMGRAGQPNRWTDTALQAIADKGYDPAKAITYPNTEEGRRQQVEDAKKMIASLEGVGQGSYTPEGLAYVQSHRSSALDNQAERERTGSLVFSEALSSKLPVAAAGLLLVGAGVGFGAAQMAPRNRAERRDAKRKRGK